MTRSQRNDVLLSFGLVTFLLSIALYPLVIVVYLLVYWAYVIVSNWTR